MALTVDKLINNDRFYTESFFQFLLYLPIGVIVFLLRLCLGLVLWIASIILPNNSTVRQMLSTLACWTFGVYVKLKGTKDPRCSVMVANYVSCLDSLAAAHAFGTISLRKWKVPPFFASTLGIRNAAQFVRKQHFADCPSKPVLLQPEGGPTNGKGLLKFTDWPFHIGNRVQPVAITVERWLTRVTVHGRSGASMNSFPWRDALWHLFVPYTVYTLRPLAAIERHDLDDEAFAEQLRTAIAAALQVEMSELKWEELGRAGPTAGPIPRRTRAEPPAELQRLARQVKDVLPRVPLRDILRDLVSTRSVDVTITNFLEGATRYTPEPEPEPEPEPQPHAHTRTRAHTHAHTRTQPDPQPTTSQAQPKPVSSRPASFQERKAQMIADARRRYIEKHGLNRALLNNC